MNLCGSVRTKKRQNRGQIEVDIQLSNDNLRVNVLRARHLVSPWNVPYNTFVKVSLMPDRSPQSWVSEVVSDTNCPVYGLLTDIELFGGYEKKCLSISIINMDTSTRNCEVLGCISLGMKRLKSKAKKKDGVHGWYHLISEHLKSQKQGHLPSSSSSSAHLPSKIVGTKPVEQTCARAHGIHGNPAARPEVRQTIQDLHTQTQTLVVYKADSGYGFTVKSSCPVRIGRVKSHGPAERAGLNKGDYIIRINGQNVSRSSAQSVAEIVRRSNKCLVMDISHPVSDQSGRRKQTSHEYVSHRATSNDKSSCNDSKSLGTLSKDLISKKEEKYVFDVIGQKSSQSVDSCPRGQENIPPYCSINKYMHSNSIHKLRTSENSDMKESHDSYVFMKRHHIEGSEDRSNVCKESTNRDASAQKNWKILTNESASMPRDCRELTNENISVSGVLTNQDGRTATDHRLLTNQDNQTGIDSRLLTNRSVFTYSDQLTSKTHNTPVDCGKARSDQVDGSSDVQDQSCTTWDPYLSHILGADSSSDRYIFSYSDINSPLHRCYNTMNSDCLDSSDSQYSIGQLPNLSPCDQTFQSCELLRHNHALHQSHDESHDQWESCLYAPDCPLAETHLDDAAGKAAILDLASCEQRFINTMQHGIQQFSRPLRHCVLSGQQHMTLFQNIEKLVALSEYHVNQLCDVGCHRNRSTELHDVQSRHRVNHSSTVGSIYKAQLKFLCCAYKSYLAGLVEAENLLLQLQQQPPFVQFLQQNEASLQTIAEFILQPKYHLQSLLDSFIGVQEHTPIHHPDHIMLRYIANALSLECLQNDSLSKPTWDEGHTTGGATSIAQSPRSQEPIHGLVQDS